MDIRADQRQTQAQTQTLSPRLQHAVRLLQMSSLDFAALVRAKLGENPFLEAEDGDDDSAQSDATVQDDAVRRLSDADLDRDAWLPGAGMSPPQVDDAGMSALDMVAQDISLSGHLHGQLNVMPLSERDLLLAGAIVESLDDDGYLRTPLQDLAALPEMAGLQPAANLDDMHIALRRVQALDPAGVGARGVAECLHLQLPAIACPQVRALARSIVTDHLAGLAARDVAKLSTALAQTPAAIEKACDSLRRLDPRPGWRFGASRIAFTVPDVVVKKTHGQWTVQLNPAVVPRVRLNRVVADLFQRHRCAQDAEMAGHLQDARWTVSNVEQRFSTILEVATAIVRRQRHFMEFGDMAMKPLGLREIADEVGVHESTVSRVTNNKFMATPLGVFELKHFFSRAMVSTNRSACSGTAIRGLVRDIIGAEKPEQPWSDAEITRQLAQQGLVIARRTVTKYRQLLHIDAVDRRRRHS